MWTLGSDIGTERASVVPVGLHFFRIKWEVDPARTLVKD